MIGEAFVYPAFCHSGRHVECEDRQGLQALPIEILPDPAYYVPSVKHEEARHRLRSGVHARKGALLLRGEIGWENTLLGRAIILNFPRAKYDTALVANPACEPGYDEKTDQSDLTIVERGNHVM